MDWSLNTSIPSGQYTVACYQNGVYIVAYESGIIYSTDGETWSNSTVPGGYAGLSSIICVNGVFTGFHYQYILQSTDGITWTSHSLPIDLDANYYLHRAAYQPTTGNYFATTVSVLDGTSGTQGFLSSDGVNWSETTANLTNINIQNLLYSEDREQFIITGKTLPEDGTTTILFSSDGHTWTFQGILPGVWGKIVYGNGQYIAIQGQPDGLTMPPLHNQVLTSPDTITWTSRTMETEDNTPIAPNDWVNMAFGSGVFTAISFNLDASSPGPRSVTTKDGITWEEDIVAPDGFWLALAYGNNKFLAASMTTNTIATADAAVVYTLPAEQGDYTVTGLDTDLYGSFLIQGEQGFYNTTGQEATLTRDAYLSLGLGSFEVTGYEATFDKGFILKPEAGEYTVNGQEANLLKDYVIQSNTGSFAVQGHDVNLRKTNIFTVDIGTVVVIGKPVIFSGDRTIIASGGSVTTTGYDLEFFRGYIMSNLSGTIDTIGFPLDFKRTIPYEFPYDLSTGNNPDLPYHRSEDE